MRSINTDKMQRRKIKAVYLDLDGTCLDTIRDVYNAVIHTVTSHGYPARTYEYFLQLAMYPIEVILAGMLPEGEQSPAFSEICAEYEAFYPDNCSLLTHHYDGMQELIDRLCRQNIVLGIITNKEQRVAEKIMRAYFPQFPFRFVMGSTPHILPKPAPDMGLAAASITGASPEETVYIGDSPSDMKFALAAGFLPVGAGWGYMSPETLQQGGAAFVADTPSSLLRRWEENQYTMEEISL